jgi:hypothetical protein
MADIAEILAAFIKDHPEAAAELSAAVTSAAAPAAAPTDAAAADEIRSGGLAGLVRRLVDRVLAPLSGPEQDAVDEVLAPHKPPAAAAASEGEQP